MSNKIRKYHGASFKFKVAMAAAKGDKSVAELCQEYGVLSSQIYAWKKQLEDQGAEKIFTDKRKADKEKINTEKLHAIIGQQKVEIDFLEKVLNP
jgi:transposase